MLTELKSFALSILDFSPFVDGVVTYLYFSFVVCAYRA
jgi:hypothetical protein